jgi:hypothetical protein
MFIEFKDRGLDEIYLKLMGLSDIQIDLQVETDQLESILEITNSFESMTSSILSSVDAMDELAKSSKAVASMSNTALDYMIKSNKTEQEAIKLNAKKQEAIDRGVPSLENQADLQEVNVELAKNQLNTYSNTAGAIGNMAGAMAGFFEENSKEQKAALIAQQVAATVAGVTAILRAGKTATGYETLPMMAAAATVVSGLLGAAGIAFSGGGFSGKSSAEIRKENIDAEYEPMLGKLDKQIELLEEIARGGSAFAYEVKKVQTERSKGTEEFSENLREGYYAGDYLRVDKYIGNSLEFLFRKNTQEQGAAFAEFASNLYSEDITADYYKPGEVQVKIPTVENFEDLYKYEDLMVFLEDMGMISTSELEDVQGDLEEFVIGSATSLAELATKVKDFSLSLQDSYDALTGTDTYEQKRLEKAKEEVDDLRGGTPLDQYIENSISKLDEVGLSSKQMADLVSGDYERITPVVEEFGDALLEITGQKTIQDLIDNIENIGLVSEAFQENMDNLLNSEEKYTDQLKQIANDRESIQKQIDQTWLGSLSILDEAGKLDYANNMYYEAQTPEDRVAAATSSAQLAMQASGTKEDYARYFARITTALENQKQDMTTTDVYNKLEEVRQEIDDLRTSQRENTINGGEYNEAIAL